MSEHITELLARLDNAKAGKEVFLKRKQDAMNSVITDEIKEQLKDIELEFSSDAEQFAKVIGELESEIKAGCIEIGASVKGEFQRVSFVKGRTTWDSKGLSGYAVAHPEILQFQKVGNPYASIKNV